MITDLTLTTKILKMTDEELDEFVVVLDEFVDIFPMVEKDLKDAVASEDEKAVSASLAKAREILQKIGADEMAEDCLKHINNIKNMSHEKIETYSIYLIASMSTLSIDIQMSVYKAKQGEVCNEKNINKKEELPEREAKPEEPKAPPMPVKPEEIVPKNILAVDDVAFFLTAMKSYLQSTPHKLTCITSGEDALRFLGTHKPDLIILDIEMPVMNGYELAAKIREMGQKAPIIFLTGTASKEHVTKAIQAGAADFIVKPIGNKEAFLAKINKYTQ